MPHQCTNCGHVFPDGSKEMLSGCPDCGGNKFQFKQGAVEDVTDSPDTQQPTPDEPDTASAAETDPTGETATDTPDPDPPADPAGSSTTDSGDAELMDSNRTDSGESPAQSTARSDIVSEDELPDSPPPESNSPTDNTASDNTTHRTDSETESPFETASPTADASEADSSGLDQLRQELNDQFESIRIVSPGQYELNLMELYDRDEYIISLREDGRYVIEVPDSWDTDTPS